MISACTVDMSDRRDKVIVLYLLRLYLIRWHMIVTMFSRLATQGEKGKQVKKREQIKTFWKISKSYNLVLCCCSCERYQRSVNEREEEEKGEHGEPKIYPSLSRK